MRYFFSTGEASGDLVAALLAKAIARIDPQAQFEGLEDRSSWSAIGPLSVAPMLPKIALAFFKILGRIKRSKPDAVILVDFGAFNVRLAKRLRRGGYKGAIIDLFPPAAWLDRVGAARAISAVALPVTAFEHQRDFFTSLGLPVHYFGHPLAAQYEMRAPRNAADPDGGTVALLPGSRDGEVRRNFPVILAAFDELRNRRPQLRGTVGVANDRLEKTVRELAARAGVKDLRFVRGTREAAADADGAFVVSGTAVLECALLGVPVVALYVVSRAVAFHFKRVYRREHITIPNLVLERAAVPEFLQDAAKPARLAQAMHQVLREPGVQYADFMELRERLGPDDALERWAQFAVESAKNAC